MRPPKAIEQFRDARKVSFSRRAAEARVEPVRLGVDRAGADLAVCRGEVPVCTCTVPAARLQRVKRAARASARAAGVVIHHGGRRPSRCPPPRRVGVVLLRQLAPRHGDEERGAARLEQALLGDGARRHEPHHVARTTALAPRFFASRDPPSARRRRPCGRAPIRVAGDSRPRARSARRTSGCLAQVACRACVSTIAERPRGDLASSKNSCRNPPCGRTAGSRRSPPFISTLLRHSSA